MLLLQPGAPSCHLGRKVTFADFPHSVCSHVRLGYISCLWVSVKPYTAIKVWRRKWQPTPILSLENPMDRRAWLATVHGVAKSQTWMNSYTCTNYRVWFSMRLSPQKAETGPEASQCRAHCPAQTNPWSLVFKNMLTKKRCTTWELWVKFYLGQNKDDSPGDSTSVSSERLLQRGSGGRRSLYIILVKGEFSAVKCLLYKVFC